MHTDTPVLMKRELERILSCNHVEQTQTNSLSLPVLSHTPPYILLRYSLENRLHIPSAWEVFWGLLTKQIKN